MNTFARHSIRVLSGIAVLTALGCSSDSTSPGSASDDGDYRGIFSATNSVTAFGGALVITIQAANATGTLTPSGGAGVSLSGTFNTSTKAVSVSGSGHTLTGTVGTGGLNGTYSGPGGSGTFATQKGTSSEVQQFCGTFTGDATGTWNLSKRANSLVGAFASDGGDSGALTGTLSGSAISITGAGGGSATGTLTSATQMTGGWTAGGGTGNWTGQSPC